MAKQQNKTIDFNQVQRFIEDLFDTDMHIRRVYSLANATLGVMTRPAPRWRWLPSAARWPRHAV